MWPPRGRSAKLELPTSRLDDEPESEPRRLRQNEGKAFQGDIERGIGLLVFDELHTYRGRQGADVTMLTRRLKERCAAPDLIHIGTSAMTVANRHATPGERRQTVHAARTSSASWFPSPAKPAPAPPRCWPRLCCAAPAAWAQPATSCYLHRQPPGRLAAGRHFNDFVHLSVPRSHAPPPRARPPHRQRLVLSKCPSSCCTR